MSVDVEHIVRDMIDLTIHLSLATVSGDAPWVCEVHFAYDDGLNMYFRSLTSRRHSRDIASNSKVAGNIVDKHGLEDPVKGLYFEGTAEVLSDTSDKERANKVLVERLKITKDVLEESEDPDGHQFYKISVDNWYVFGDFDGNGAMKHKLEWGDR